MNFHGEALNDIGELNSIEGDRVEGGRTNSRSRIW